MYLTLLFRRLCAILVAVANFIGFSLGINTGNATPADDFRVTSYIVGKYVYDISALHSEDFDIITDVILFGCANFTAEGEVVLEKDTLETALGNIRTVIGDRDISISLNILGPSYTSNGISWEDDMEQQSIEHNKAFASGVLEENIKEVIEYYDFDGVHFDYEHPIKLKHWNKYSNFLISLDKVMPDRTIGIAVAEWNADISTMAIEAVDYFELMLYDIYDEADGRHSTAETATELSHKATMRGIPTEKINFGLPFYARPTDHDAYWYDYRSYYDKLDENNFYYDEELQKSFWFNTPDVIGEKTEYAMQNGFGGVMIWHYTCDLPSTDPDSLLRAIGEATKGN